VTSRSLNTKDDIEKYFKDLDPKDLPAAKKGEFVPSDIIDAGGSAEPTRPKVPSAPRKRTRKVTEWVIPRDFHVVVGDDRLVAIREELTHLERDSFPNAGAVLLRVFLELSVLDYLGRTGRLTDLVAKLEKKNALQPGQDPKMSQLVPEMLEIAKGRLTKTQAENVRKALTYDRGARFNISDFHAFVHQLRELPTGTDIKAFWNRTEPLFQLMLGQDAENGHA
jgi:hypothetical protein